MLILTSLALACVALACGVVYAVATGFLDELERTNEASAAERDALRRERTALLAELAAERRRHREEQAELLNRIMHPRIYQPTPAQEQTIRETKHAPPDEFELAGTIQPFTGPEEDLPPGPPDVLPVGEAA